MGVVWVELHLDLSLLISSMKCTISYFVWRVYRTAVGRSSELYSNRLCLAKFDQSGKDGECLELLQVVMTSSGV